MRCRLYFLLPNVNSALQTVDDLLLSRIEERHIHVLAKDGIPMEGLHEASVWQKSDIAHGAEMGLAVGGVAGVLVGLLVVYFPPNGVSLQLVTVLITAVFGALFGAWVSSMVASRIPNSRLKSFEKEIAEGRILMMVDVPSGKAGFIRDLIARRHPEASAGGTEATIPAFP